MRVQSIHTKHLRWIDIVKPETKEIEWLNANFKLHPLHLQAVAEHQQRPHIDHGPNYDFIVLLFPVYHKSTQEILPGEVDFIVGEGFLLTLHYGEMHTLQRIFQQAHDNHEHRQEFMQKGSGYLLYKVLEALFRRSYPILDYMNSDIAATEDKIFRDHNIDMLSRILMMKKNIIEFRKMMKTHNYVLESLPKRRVGYLSFPHSKVYYKDLLEYSHNIWDILEALKETVDTLQETSQALAAHRLNRISKIISIFSAIVIPATLIAFLFGVGVEGIPFRNHPNGFWIVAGLMGLSSILLLVFFRLMKWF